MLGLNWHARTKTNLPYVSVSMKLGPRTYGMKKVHTMVLETFVGPRPDGMVGCHNDSDPRNNELGNLRWDTQSANILQAIAEGTFKVPAGYQRGREGVRGSKSNFSKITEDVASEIKARLISGEKIISIAEALCLPESTVKPISYGKTWAHTEPLLPALGLGFGKRGRKAKRPKI